ncbi:MAG: cyclic pyranopterin monophosphate synthase MoaC [Elusimicrobia bacterium]|nr:cyclic pyranopterin monophosphate synthase MoaC [Elusimicrobiota bacterium]
MVDISDKKPIMREAIAKGRIILKETTIEQIKSGNIKKGDPFTVAQIAAINAIKETSHLIPLCHQINLDSIDVSFEIKEKYIETKITVKAEAKTGVEMEAIVGICAALFTIWDMVKYLEKDSEGQYPSTKITDIVVVKKRKYG